jgi:hypothetical protein
MARATQVKINVPIMFNRAMGTMSESCYNNPHQEKCVVQKYHIANTKDAR